MDRITLCFRMFRIQQSSFEIRFCLLQRLSYFSSAYFISQAGSRSLNSPSSNLWSQPIDLSATSSILLANEFYLQLLSPYLIPSRRISYLCWFFWKYPWLPWHRHLWAEMISKTLEQWLISCRFLGWRSVLGICCFDSGGTWSFRVWFGARCLDCHFGGIWSLSNRW